MVKTLFTRTQHTHTHTHDRHTHTHTHTRTRTRTRTHTHTHTHVVKVMSLTFFRVPQTVLTRITAANIFGTESSGNGVRVQRIACGVSVRD